MKNILYKITFGLMFSLLAAGCTSNKVVYLNDGFRLTSRQVADLIVKSEGGDGVSAYRLSRYYGFYLGDGQRSDFYLDQAIKLGNSNAMVDRAVFYLDKFPADIESARPLLERAEKLNNEQATVFLKKIDSYRD